MWLFNLAAIDNAGCSDRRKHEANAMCVYLSFNFVCYLAIMRGKNAAPLSNLKNTHVYGNKYQVITQLAGKKQ